jgi:CO/xanthine dehydrogenase Mo-binding subunit
MLGALLAGLPSTNASAVVPVTFASLWLYDRIPLSERMFGLPNIGADNTSAGLRGGIMRTPGHRQPAFALESIMNEAAAAAGVDPVEFRIRHTTDRRLIELLQMTADAAGWKPRPSPSADARRSGSSFLRGRGVGVISRANGYWVGIAEVAVTPDTGQVRVDRFTLGVDVGKIINPRQLDNMARGGVVMGLSEALKEEVTFDRRAVTSTDWRRYPILTMAETPEITVVHTSHDDRGFANGAEAANATPTQAVAAAFYDATGVAARRLPLTPDHVKALLRG